MRSGPRPVDRPFLSVIVPCRDEVRFVGRCLDSILANDYPAGRMEVLVIVYPKFDPNDEWFD